MTLADTIADAMAAQYVVLLWTAGVLAAASIFLWRLDVARRRDQARRDALEAVVAEARRVQGIPPERHLVDQPEDPTVTDYDDTLYLAGPVCCTDSCCGPGSYCCARANPHTHPELDDTDD